MKLEEATRFAEEEAIRTGKTFFVCRYTYGEYAVGDSACVDGTESILKFCGTAESCQIEETDYLVDSDKPTDFFLYDRFLPRIEPDPFGPYSSTPQASPPKNREEEVWTSADEHCALMDMFEAESEAELEDKLESWGDR